jgi:hypothetical protein
MLAGLSAATESGAAPEPPRYLGGYEFARACFDLASLTAAARDSLMFRLQPGKDVPS